MWDKFLGWLYKVIKLLKPKYYNKITLFTLAIGASFSFQPLWAQLILIYCQRNKIPTIINENDPIFGVIFIVLALTYNTIHRWLELKHLPTSRPAHEIVTSTVFETFELMCQDIYLILKDNEYIFKMFGPNSGAAYSDELLREDFTIWNQLKIDSILPNNDVLLSIIEQNQARIPAIHVEIFNKMKAHIHAFKTHTEKPTFDYTQFQFPKEFPTMIEEVCYSNAKINSNLKNEITWLERRIKKLSKIEAYLFGSIVVIPEKAFDTDIVLLTESNKQNIQRLDKIRESFRIRYHKDLHITLFKEDQKDDYKAFIDKNNLKIKLLNG